LRARKIFHFPFAISHFPFQKKASTPLRLRSSRDFLPNLIVKNERLLTEPEVVKRNNEK